MHVIKKETIQDIGVVSSAFDSIKLIELQELIGVALPPTYLYVLLNFGVIKHDKVQHVIEVSDYYKPMFDNLLSLEGLEICYRNIWKEHSSHNQCVESSNYIPIISTYDSNIIFLCGAVKENLDEIFLYDFDYEDFEPLKCFDDIFSMLETMKKIF